jgi:hypothetical protein
LQPAKCLKLLILPVIKSDFVVAVKFAGETLKAVKVPEAL